MAKDFYDHAAIELKWNKRWQEEKLYEVDPKEAEDKFYCLDMFPYPSGEGLHVGHWRGYVLSDFYARYWRLMGKTVLHPMGFDAFGLPAENAAIKNMTHPREFTEKAIPTFTNQLKQVGAAYDWSKVINTSTPDYYKWTQWLFLQLYKHGYAEKREGLVNWCPNDQTVLANEQVVDGKCERCGTVVTKKSLSQWYLKTTALADELLDGLEEVNWPEHVKTLQRNWIGRSDGAEIVFGSTAGEIKVFTTRPDTIFGVTAIVLAPENPLVAKLTNDKNRQAIEGYLSEVRAKTNIDRQQQKETAKTAVFTEEYATHPLTNDKLPIWIADYVLMDYGTGAAMSVPAHDERDFQFARTHNLPIIQVIAPKLVQSTEPAKYRPDEPTANGQSVIVFVKHPTEDKYLGLDWKEGSWGAKTLLTGTIDDLSPEETVVKEIREETGYKNAKISQKLGVIDGLFYHLPKKTNKLVRGHVFLVELENEEQDIVDSAEQARHDLVWLTKEDLAKFLTPETHQFILRWLDAGFTPYTEAGTLVNSGIFDSLESDEASAKIVTLLENDNKGKKATTYRLRDWLVSRQRYWGAPIPIVYDPDGKLHEVKDEHLPLLLPDDVDFLPGGESPLARSNEYQERAEKLYGQGWHFETDTLDTFVDSSWYFLRYLSPGDTSVVFDPELVKKWLPVDLYIGGIEHATLHLLYARFIARFLAKNGYTDASTAEPFKQLFNIGMITLHGAKMSKSKGNVVSPDPLIEHYGTDALRGYELFVGPMDIEAEWNVNGINGIHRFLIKAFQFKEKVVDSPAEQAETAAFNHYLREVNKMIAGFRLNTVISEAMKLINSWGSKAVSETIFKEFLITLSPIFPYLTEELWEAMGEKQSIFHAKWPTSGAEAASMKELSVRVNHKHIGIQQVEGNESQDEVMELVQTSDFKEKVPVLDKTRIIYKPGLFIDFVSDTA
ncbi:MAG: class I tRNA ligase family protein [Candidatus Berkelbacteria bacterium]|nr:MAG: class I tRNA ligase family protein [Candidatus Berkelbacteria bacterium]QQG52134.1 MAG: class I tRNA ligase family protein [Candidatus Berkelbacteria bacterium]